jgi:hypothetical protein
MPRKSPAAVDFPERTERLRPPPDLVDDDERQAFASLVLACRPDFFTEAHLPLLAAYSRAVVLERAASKGLREDRHVLRDGKPSPWLPILALASRQLTTLSRALRLSPASQHATPTPKEPPLPPSYFERMALEHRDGDREPN